MDGVPYPQPLTAHEPQYVPWGVLLVRPIGLSPRPVAPRAADQRSRAYPTLLRELRWGRYGHPGGPQTLGQRLLWAPFIPPPPPPRPLCWPLPPPLSTLGFPPVPRPFLFSQAPAVPCSPPAFSLLPSPRRHFACQFLGRARAACRIVYSDLVGYQTSDIRLLWTITPKPPPPPHPNTLSNPPPPCVPPQYQTCPIVTTPLRCRIGLWSRP